MTRADAPPPPLQIPATPIFPLCCLKTPSNVTTILAPEAPNGWPIATAPPWTLIFSDEISRSFWFANATTLKASLISKKSTLSIEIPACFNAMGMASEGEVVNLIGFWAASPQPRILAKGVRLYFSMAVVETRTTAAAPSESGEALGAVIVPVWVNAGRTVLNFSTLSYRNVNISSM